MSRNAINDGRDSDDTANFKGSGESDAEFPLDLGTFRLKGDVLRGVNEHLATLRRGPRPVLNVFESRNNQERPRLSDGNNLHGLSFVHTCITRLGIRQPLFSHVGKLNGGCAA